MLGGSAALNPLLEILRSDPSPQIRQRAAFSLSQAGMLTKDGRLAAFSDLLNDLDDDSLNNAARSLVFPALRDISGVALPNASPPRRGWWAKHDRGPHRDPPRSGLSPA